MAALADPQEPAPAELLETLAWSPGTPVPVSVAAIESLAQRDADKLLDGVAALLDQIDRWSVIEASVDSATRALDETNPPRERRVRLAAASARSLARPSTRYADVDRPEYRLLLAATDAQIPAQALLQLVDADARVVPHTTLSDRTAAWSAYHRLVGAERANNVAAGLTSETLPAATLRRLAPHLDQLPHNTITLAWALDVDLPASTGDVSGIALRHLPILRHGTELRQALNSTDPAPAPPTAAAPRRIAGAALAELPGEDYRDAAPRLSAADRLHLAVIAAALRRPEVVAELFATADADHADTTTERGGLLLLAEETSTHPTFREYPPMLARGDHAYVPGPELILDLQRRGLAHVHFHAQRHANADYAGPAGGDLAFVQRQAVAAVVLTFLDPDTLNADYVQPDPVDPNATPIVIDLGNLTRPR